MHSTSTIQKTDGTVPEISHATASSGFRTKTLMDNSLAAVHVSGTPANMTINSMISRTATIGAIYTLNMFKVSRDFRDLIRGLLQVGQKEKPSSRALSQSAQESNGSQQDVHNS